MNVRVLFFASLREKLGCREAAWTLAAGSRVADLWSAVCAKYPQAAPLGPSMSFAVNQEYVEPGCALSEGDEVALIPPVSGGLDV